MSQKSHQSHHSPEEAFLLALNSFLKVDSDKARQFNTNMESTLVAVHEICQETNEMENKEEERLTKQKILYQFLIKKVKEFGTVDLSQNCSVSGSQNNP